jgi:hypothetical protein
MDSFMSYEIGPHWGVTVLHGGTQDNGWHFGYMDGGMHHWRRFYRSVGFLCISSWIISHTYVLSDISVPAL